MRAAPGPGERGRAAALTARRRACVRRGPAGLRDGRARAGSGTGRVRDLQLPVPEPVGPHDLQQYLDRTADTHRIRDPAQLLQLVEMGSIVYLLPLSVTLRYPRAGLVYRRVTEGRPRRSPSRGRSTPAR
ncbi:hypothetical protein GCM10023322_35590 [Rugosimonospora acidiphila]|uniref:Uncharacterized protein n=1 Tax=Rugosimonospora acidiphila TaxID=556531 RepID=A0ABP9RVQ0_9ACTN